MNKEKMLLDMVEAGCYALVVSHYAAAGYTEKTAKQKTVEYFSQRLTAAEVKDLYAYFIKEVWRW